jgi:hypothetical protein
MISVFLTLEFAKLQKISETTASGYGFLHIINSNDTGVDLKKNPDSLAHLAKTFVGRQCVRCQAMPPV